MSHLNSQQAIDIALRYEENRVAIEAITGLPRERIDAEISSRWNATGRLGPSQCAEQLRADAAAGLWPQPAKPRGHHPVTVLLPLPGLLAAAPQLARRCWDRALSRALGTPGRQCEDRTDHGLDR